MTWVIPNSFLKAWRKIKDANEFSEIQASLLKQTEGIKRGTIGAFVIQVETKTQRIRYIKNEKLEEIEGVEFAPSEQARIVLETLIHEGYLKRKMKKSIFGFRKEHVEQLQNSHPAIFAKSGEYKDMIYLDIKGFYFNTYRRSLIVTYQRGRYLGIGEPIPRWAEEFLKDRKTTRNVLYGLMRISRRTEIRNGQIQIKYAINKFFNPQLCALIYDMGQAIAKVFVEKFQAVYFNIDGAILPRRNIQKALEFLQELGYKGEIRYSGERCIVKGVGNYGFFEGNILKACSKPFRAQRNPNNYSNLYLSDEEASFILSRWKRIKTHK